jgi:hypothetical protein
MADDAENLAVVLDGMDKKMLKVLFEVDREARRLVAESVIDVAKQWMKGNI